MQLKITQKTHSWRLLYGVIQTTKALWEVATESENESKRRLKIESELMCEMCIPDSLMQIIGCDDEEEYKDKEE